MRFREATAEDADVIAALHAESWRRAYRGAYSDAYLDGPVHDDRREVWRERYAAAGQQPPGGAERRARMYTLLAIDDDESLLGFACSFGADDPKWGTLLDNLHVSGAAEGRGIGRQLVAASALWSERAYPDAGFFLWVLDGNARARPFYEYIGATNEGPTEMVTPDGGGVTVLRYVWHSIDPLRQYAPTIAEG
ncbi:MAG: GNAT family N-acetyltransferase [Chloroflexi bacterium]|nr:GNAT family N-acetyltransferase [Chloroflexota bacterium]MDA1145376.1 GNAT family N-acetyltransferase [Chloroflexota bacterium]